MPRKTLLGFSMALFVLAILAGSNIVPGSNAVAIQLVMVFLVVVLLRQLVLIALALQERPPPRATGEAIPTVSVIVPAYNEEAVIEAALDSIAALDYPNLQVIVVDDGSVDGTAEAVRRVIRRQPTTRIQLIIQTNAGKSAALNTGLRHAEGEFVLTVDADSHLHPQALLQGLPHFRDPRVVAVGGYVMVRNETSLLARFQQLEYLISLNFTRRALSRLGMVTVVPGPVGLFRRHALLGAGGYNETAEVFAEDAELTVRLLGLGWRIKGESSMIAYTEAPDRVFPLLRQRYRWKRGIFQAFDQNVFLLVTSPSLRGVGVAALLAFEGVVLELFNFAVTLFFLSHFVVYGEISIMVWAFLLIIMLDVMVLVLFARSHGSFLSLLPLMLLQRISYSYLLLAWGVLALFDEWLASKMAWDKLDRIGNAREARG